MDTGASGLLGHVCLRVAPQISTEARDRDVGLYCRNVPWSPENILIDTVARLQRDLADIKAESRQFRTPGVPHVVPTPWQAAFMTTKVPRFTGKTSWDQYRQVFEAIVCSNGWDDTMAALQLLSHLEGDALNVALLVPAPRRTSKLGLVDALSEHYGSPGRLADYRRQFEKTTRMAGEDPSIFAVALETLAVKAFGDMGQTAQLHLIRDCLKAGHSSVGIWTVFHQKLLSVMSWTDAECGKAMRIQRSGGSVSQDLTRFIRPT